MVYNGLGSSSPILPMTQRKLIEWGLVSLAFGFLCTLVIAWGTSWLFLSQEYPSAISWRNEENVSLYYGSGGRDNCWTIDLEKYSFGIQVGTLTRWNGSDSRMSFGGELDNYSGTKRRIDDIHQLPSWSRSKSIPSRDTNASQVVEVAAGWPCAALKGEWRTQSLRQAGGAMVQYSSRFRSWEAISNPASSFAYFSRCYDQRPFSGVESSTSSPPIPNAASGSSFATAATDAGSARTVPTTSPGSPLAQSVAIPSNPNNSNPNNPNPSPQSHASPIETV